MAGTLREALLEAAYGDLPVILVKLTKVNPDGSGDLDIRYPQDITTDAVATVLEEAAAIARKAGP